MLHLLADPRTDARPEPYAEAVARLASVKHALRLVAPSGSGPAPDVEDDLSEGWDRACDARRQLFDVRSAKMVSAAAAGLEALLIERQNAREPHPEASRELVDQIRRELAEVARVVLA